MRPQQQNRRMRGRNNGGGGGGNNNNNNNNNNNSNRKGPNPLTRNYESNGPDVKIRGSAQQIAEKYTTLARDATSSGDRVMAENYLQHAEHYNRIIASAQAQFAAQQVHPIRDDADDDMDDSQFSNENNGTEPAHFQPSANHVPAPAVQSFDGSGPQPIIDGLPAEVALNNSGGGGQQPSGGRQHRERRPYRQQPDNGSIDQQAGNGSSDQQPVMASGGQDESADTSVQQNEAIAAPMDGEERQAPRRGRRPRRGDRRDEQVNGSEEGREGPSTPQPEADSAKGSGDDRPIMETVEN